tara:strand:- start:376 stop:735 length:360 start_codon:yes stop_codon:yes gene_type:complete
VSELLFKRLAFFYFGGEGVADFPEIFQKLKKHEGQFPATILQANDCDVYFSTLQAGTLIPPHRHDTDNYSIIIEGELILDMYGAQKAFAVGQWCFVPADTEHSATTKVDTRLIEFWFRK